MKCRFCDNGGKMRRSDFDCKDLGFIQEFLNKIEFGTLVIPDGIPYAVLKICFFSSKSSTTQNCPSKKTEKKNCVGIIVPFKKLEGI